MPHADRRIFLWPALVVVGLAILLWRIPRGIEKVEPVVDLGNAPSAPTPGPTAIETERAPLKSQAADVIAHETEPAMSSAPRALEALRPFEALVADFPPNGSSDDNFDHVEFGGLRHAVEAGRLTAEDLAGALSTLAPDDALRPLALAAFAFVPDVTESHRAELASVANEAIGLEGWSSSLSGRARLRHASSFAAVFALGVHGADAELTQVNAAFAKSWSDYASSSDRRPADLALLWPTRDVMVFALENMQSLDDPPTRNSIASIVDGPPQALLTTAAWGALARAGPAEVARTLEAALAGQGHAREGLESVNDPAATVMLEDLVRAHDGSVYANYVAMSAARGLLSIGTPKAASAFEDLALSSDPQIVSSVTRALEKSPPPAALGALLMTRWRMPNETPDEPGPLCRALDKAIERVCGRLQRATVSRRDAAACCAGARAVLQQGALHGGPLQTTCMRVLVLAGDDADRRAAEGLAQRMPEAERAVIFAALALRRGTR